MNKSYTLLKMYDDLKSGKPIKIGECCASYGISVPTFRRYMSFLRAYFCEIYSLDVIYDSGLFAYYLSK